METYLTRVTDYLLTQSWQIALLVVVIAAVSLVLRNKSAHVRYLLWLIVLAKCLVPPLLTVPVAILPQEEAAEPVRIFPATEMAALNPAVADMATTEPPILPAEPAAMAPVSMAWERPTKINIRQWLGAGWIVGAIAFLVFNLLKALRASLWLWRQRKPLPAELLSDIENLFSAHGIKSSPGVWQVDGISQPFVWGLLRGSIYLPADLLSLKNSKRCKSLLGHELSHIIRFDAAVNFLQVVVQTIFWFHPFVWWSNRKIRAEREKCCDEMAIARLYASPRDYSTAIVETLAAKHESVRPVPSLAVAGPVKNIEERIKTMLRPGKKFYKRPSLVSATAVLLLALLTVPTALVLTARANSKTAEGDEALTQKSTEAAEAAYGYRLASDPNFVAWWRLDDGSGSSARDSSGNDNHGALHGDPQWTTGRIGRALDFDGDGDYVDCGNPDVFNFDEQMTAGAWVNLRSIPGEWRTVVAKGQDGWRLALTRKMPSFNFSVAGRAFGYPSAYCATQVAFGEWHHVCGTYDGQEIRIYLDGQIDATLNHTHGIATNDANLLIGDNPQTTGRFWNGLIDEVFVFSRALSGGEIRAVMQGLSDPAAAQESGPADQVQTNSIGMKLVWIPPGEFMMGSKNSPWQVTRRYGGNPVWYQNQHPRRKVTLTRGFWMGESEVTQAQYQAVMGSNPSRSKSNDLPVEMVSWHHAMEFCRKLSEKEGRTYTLPTEAQWEYAARAGTDTAYCFGDDPSQLGEYAWLRNTGKGTHPVKMKKPNGFGLHDVHGNVWEWCLDWYQDSYNGLDHVDPLGPRSGQSRVARGGARHFYAGPYRSAVRERYNPDARNRYLDVGFRVVLLVVGVD